MHNFRINLGKITKDSIEIQFEKNDGRIALIEEILAIK
jgi:hypothetical protein